MKILHLIDSGGLYGAENVIINLSLELNKNKCQSIIGCIASKGKKKSEIGRKAESLQIETVYFVLKNKYDLRCIKDIASYIESNKIGIIHSHGYKPSIICLLLKVFYKISYVITCHLWYKSTAKLAINFFFEMFSMRFARYVVGVSEDIVQSLYKSGVSRDRLRLIENGINVLPYFDLSNSEKLQLRNELGLKKDSFIVGSLGRLTEQKDYQTFIKAAAEILKERSNIEFVIAGDGNLKSALIKLSKDLRVGERVHLIGFRRDTIPILKLMDIFVLSSLDEGLPVAMLEAMSVRRPIVVTSVGGIPKVIQNGVNGILIKKSNSRSLKENLINLIDDNKKRETLGKNAYDTVKGRYTNNLMAEKYLDIYATLQ